MCEQQVLPVVDGRASQTTPLAEGDFITNIDPTTGAKNPDRVWVPNPFTCQQVVMDYAESTNPFYVDPQNPRRRLCDSSAGSCAPPCTPTSTGTCSFPATAAGMPPSDVTGPMTVDTCRGFFAKFAVGATTCPAQVGSWSGGFGDHDANVVQSNGAPAVVVHRGDELGAPEVGFQIDFPSLPATIPVGCTAQTTGPVPHVSCAPPRHNEVLALVPGRYGDITVRSSATRVLEPGDYMFDALELERGAKLDLPTSQRVRIVTKNDVELNADVKCFDLAGVVDCAADTAASNFGVMDLGTSDVLVGTTLPGTVVAPHAAIVVTPGFGGVTYGAFWSKKRVNVLSRGKIVVPSENVFFDPTEASAYPACR